MKRTYYLIALVAVLLLTSQAAVSTTRVIVRQPPPECWSYCDIEGESRGCVFSRNGTIARTGCTCVNGVWNCSVF